MQSARLSVLGILLLSANIASADETRIARSSVPKPVLDAVVAKYPKAKMLEFSRETEEHGTVYEVKLEASGARVEVEVSPEGAILEEERVISPADLPSAVKAALLRSRYAKAKVERAEKVTATADPEHPTYELEVVLDAKRSELVFSADGRLLRVESSEDRDDD